MEEDIKHLQKFIDIGKTCGETGLHVILKPPHFEKIENLINKYKELQKENRILKEHIHFKICPNCKKEFESKRSDAIYCKECSSQVNNKKFYYNMSEETKQERREKSKIKMREIRAKRKAEGE